ncbi:MAG TPA: alpha/beta hydrolase [Acidobacteriota bacterium]|nr:alpha/beta hydrolase [Acidobacteriota bacterium]
MRHWRQLGREFRHRGKPIFYRYDGAGPVLLCIHGFPTASWDWHRVWKDLTGHFRVVAPDLIGFGFSAKPRHYDYSIFDQADLIEGLLRQLDISEVDILAHDYGDTVAQELLARHIEGGRGRRASGLGLRSVCFLNGGLIPDANRPLFIQKLLLSPLGKGAALLLGERTFRRNFSRLFAPGKGPDDAEMAQYWRLVSRGRGLAIMHRLIQYLKERKRWEDRWVGALAQSDVPLRLIAGALDSISGGRMAERYRQVVPAADVITLEEAAHYPHLEVPDLVLSHFHQFIERTLR